MVSPLKGKKQSPEHIAKRTAAMVATITANPEVRRWTPERHAAAKVYLKGINKGPRGPMSDERKAKIAASMKGKQNCLGHKLSEGHRRKLSEYWAEHREEHNHYVDGKGLERRKERGVAMGRLEYRLWREAVFERDDWTCVQCGDRGVRLQADHIKAYALFPELRYELSNGRTLCVPCHLKQPTHGVGSHRAKTLEIA